MRIRNSTAPPVAAVVAWHNWTLPQMMPRMQQTLGASRWDFLRRQQSSVSGNIAVAVAASGADERPMSPVWHKAAAAAAAAVAVAVAEVAASVACKSAADRLTLVAGEEEVTEGVQLV